MGWVLLLLPLVDPPANTGGPAAPAARSQVPLVLAVSTAPTPGEAAASQDAPRTSPPVEPQQSAEPVDPDQASGMPTMQFRGFSDVSYRLDDESGTANSFSIGQFNLFITSKLTDKLSVLAEVVVEADLGNKVGIDLERLLLRWVSSDFLSVSAGRYHTAIGWYNTAYHHSAWMQTAIGRPLLFAFEDDGGFLPIHDVGLSLGGRIPSGSLGLRYIFEVGNGAASRSIDDEPVQNVVDENNGKAVNVGLLARPAGLPGFEAGISVYHDTLAPEGGPKIGETIVAGHAVYQTSGVEWLNEVVYVRNATADGGPVFDTVGFYTQASKQFGAWRPYFRYQYVNAPEDDPVFPGVGLQHGPSVGLRFDVADSAALKFQYDRTERRDLAGYNSFAVQVSFTF